ncbi:hypothetical protein [Vibrio mediterranei]|uniref:hypothetical protein n=1 Tax=Vibrio mediterranei TaxID=689 RepID=UPI004068A48B
MFEADLLENLTRSMRNETEVEAFIDDVVARRGELPKIELTCDQFVEIVHKGSICLPRNNPFSHMFASGECAVFADGMDMVLWSIGVDSKIIGGRCKAGNTVHYYNRFDLDGLTFCLDAYGIFDDEAYIHQRYVTPIVSTFVVDEEEDNKDVQAWRDRTYDIINLFESEKLLEEDSNGDTVCVFTGEQIHYTEVYESYAKKSAERLFDLIEKFRAQINSSA